MFNKFHITINRSTDNIFSPCRRAFRLAMVCLSDRGLALGLNVNIKDEVSRTVVGIFATAFIHYFLQKFIFSVNCVKSHYVLITFVCF
jgi:hypothetical protein